MSVLSAHFSDAAASPSKEEVEIFMNAATSGDVKTIAGLLSTYGDNIVNARDKDGNAALERATRSRKIDVAALLLEKGANIEAKSLIGYTALMSAAWTGRADIATLLLEHGAHIETKDDNGTAALDWAVRAGNEDVERIIRQWPETLRQRLEQQAHERAAEIKTIHAGIDQAVKTSPRLVLRLPTKVSFS